MESRKRYTKVLQRIKQDHANELSDELKEEIDSLLKAGETLPVLEQTERYLSIIAKFLEIVENLRDWL